MGHGQRKPSRGFNKVVFYLPWLRLTTSSLQAFTEFGQVQDANIVMDRETGRSRGFGFVTFAEKSQAEAACNQMNQAVSSHFGLNREFAVRRPLFVLLLHPPVC